MHSNFINDKGTVSEDRGLTVHFAGSTKQEVKVTTFSWIIKRELALPCPERSQSGTAWRHEEGRQVRLGLQGPTNCKLLIVIFSDIQSKRDSAYSFWFCFSFLLSMTSE